LKQAPLPILDMNNALNQAKEETEKRKITKVIAEIEQLIISNHLPKSKFTQKTEASLGSQFQFYVSNKFWLIQQFPNWKNPLERLSA
jgi:NADH:ubiquinone oxidoreductase subunit D